MNIKIAKKLADILHPVDCEECPLKEPCDLTEENEYGTICRILDVEKEEVE